MCGFLLVWSGFFKFKVPEDMWQPITELLSELKAKVMSHEGMWGIGLMSRCYSVEGLCSVEQSCLCNLIQCAFWTGARRVLPLELYPGVGLESSLVCWFWLE